MPALLIQRPSHGAQISRISNEPTNTQPSLQRLAPRPVSLAISIALPCLLGWNQASAQDDVAQQEPLVVTATRQAQSLDDVLAAVTLISRDDIERSQAQDISELLRTVPGVDLVRTGPIGTQTSLFLRGTNSNQVLVLIDGVRASEAGNGLFVWEHLALDQVERIEIVRGPRAAYYGSDAVGGVIQIFTRQHQGAQIRVGAGSYSTRSGSVAVGGRSGAWDGRLSLSQRQAEGFSAQNPNGFSFDRDNDGYRNFSLNAGAGYQFDGGRVGLSFLHTDAESDFDQGVSDTAIQNVAVQIQLENGAAWRHQGKAGYARNELVTDGGFFSSRLETQRWDFSWLSAYRFNDALEVQGGVDFYSEQGDDPDNYDETRDNLGVYTGLSWNQGRHDVAASVRLDDDENFGSEFTGQLAWGWELVEGLRFNAAYGRSFRAPNFNQLYSPGFGGLFAGNPELEPETADSYELGLRYQWQRHSADVRLYQNDLDNLIDFSGPDFQAINVQKARAKGVEFSYSWRPEHWQVDAQVTWQDAENRSTDSPLLRRADIKTSLVVERQIGNGHSIGTEFVYVGDRPDVGGIELSDYALLNLRGRLQISPDWRLEARVENLVSDQYEPAFGFNGQGRSVFFNLTWDQSF